MAIFLSMYVVYAFTVICLIQSGQRREKFSAVMIALTFPFMLLFAVFAVFFRATLAIKPCPEGLEEAEAVVERQRLLMFPGKAIQPSIAKAWRRHYAMSVGLQARKMRNLSRQIQAHLAAV